MGGLIIPKYYVDVSDSPVIFLAGPIACAPNWQDLAVEIIYSHNLNLFVVSPRHGIREPIAKYAAQGSEEKFHRQRAWERHYLQIAGEKGAILFWLPEQEKHECDKVYGAMTRIELGQWMTNYKINKSIGLCIGSDMKFPGLDTIKYDLSLDAPDKEIKSGLEETCMEALRITSVKH